MMLLLLQFLLALRLANVFADVDVVRVVDDVDAVKTTVATTNVIDPTTTMNHRRVDFQPQCVKH